MLFCFGTLWYGRGMLINRFPWGPLRFVILTVAGLFAIFYKHGFIGVVIAILTPIVIWDIYRWVSKSRLSESLRFLHPVVDLFGKLFWLLMFLVVVGGLCVLFAAMVHSLP